MTFQPLDAEEPIRSQVKLLHRITRQEAVLTDPKFIIRTNPSDIEATSAHPDLVIFLYDNKLNGMYYRQRVTRVYQIDEPERLLQVIYSLHVSADAAGKTLFRNVNVSWNRDPFPPTMTNFSRCVTTDGGLVMSEHLEGGAGGFIPEHWSPEHQIQQLKNILEELIYIRNVMKMFS